MSSFYNNSLNQPSQQLQHQHHHHHHHTTSVINFPKVIVQPIQSTFNIPRTNGNHATIKRPYFNPTNSNSNSDLLYNATQSKQLDTQFNELFDLNNNELHAQQHQHQQPVYLIFDEEEQQLQQQQQQQQNNVLILNDQQSQWVNENTPSKTNKLLNKQQNSSLAQHAKLPVSSIVVPTITNVDEIFFLLSQKIAKYCQILSDLTNCEVFYKAQLPLQSNPPSDSSIKSNKKYKSCSSAASNSKSRQNQRSLYWGTHQMLFQYSHDQGIRYDKAAGDSLIKLNQRSISTDVNKLVEEILNAPSSDLSKESSASSSSEQTETINLEKSSNDEFNLIDELNQIKEAKILKKSSKPSELKFKDCCVHLNKLNDDITNEDYFFKFEMKHNNLESNFMIGHDIIVDEPTSTNQELSLIELPPDSELYSDQYTLNFTNTKKSDDSDEENDDDDSDEDEKTLIEKNCLNNSNEINENDENYYKCEQCASSIFSYKHLTQLKVHELRKHLDINPTNGTCGKCGLSMFDSREEFYKHSIVCYFPNVYQCKACNQMYDNYAQYFFHIRYIHAQVVYMCSLCQRKYKHIKDLIDHDQLMHSKSLNYCELCYESFKTRQLLYDHLKQSHLIIQSDDLMVENQTTTVDKDQLEKLNNNESVMTKKFVLTAEPDENEENSVNNNNNSTNANDENEDDEEEEQFVVKSAKNSTKPIQTTSLSTTSTTAKVQKNELIRGLIDRKHQCKWCSLRFYTKSQLKQHEQVHTNAMLNCPVCDKQFTSKDRLNGHMKCHMEPSLECKVCGKKFKRLCNLYNHELVHGLTEHAFMLCQFCGRGFRSRRDYQNHVIANHRDHLMKVDSDGKIIEDSNENNLLKSNRRQRKTNARKLEHSTADTSTNPDSADDTYFTRTGVHFVQDDLDQFQLDEDEENDEEEDEEFNENKRLKKDLRDKNKVKKFKLMNSHIEVEEDVITSSDYASVRNAISNNNISDKNSTHSRSTILTQLFEESFN